MDSGAFIVAYALNAKKLRESEATTSSSSYSSSSYRSSTSALGSADTSPITIWSGGGLADIVSNSSAAFKRAHNVKFVAFDYSLPPERHPHYHVLIHKLTEDIIAIDDSSDGSNSHSTSARHKIKSVTEYIDYNKKCVIVDPIASVRVVTSRLETLKRIDNIRAKNSSCDGAVINQPGYMYVSSSATTDEIARGIVEGKMTFPVICKPVSACGHQDSHSMAVVLSAEGLETFKNRPCLVQKYHDHGGILCKVYVIAEDIFVCTRRSLPNLQAQTDSLAAGDSGVRTALVFDSRKAYPQLRDFYTTGIASDNNNNNNNNNNNKEEKEACDDEELADSHQTMNSYRDVFRSYARQLREGLGLTLFGFDVIVPVSGSDKGRAMVIDVNFFPSYKEVVDFPDRLCDYLKKAHNG